MLNQNPSGRDSELKDLPVDGLFNHYFSVDGEEYEYVDGLFFKKVCVMPSGKSFGEIAL